MKSNDAVGDTDDRRNSAGATAADRSLTRKALGSAVWERVAGDPLVQRVKEAVDGTLVDIRRPEDPVDENEAVGNSEEEESSE